MGNVPLFCSRCTGEMRLDPQTNRVGCPRCKKASSPHVRGSGPKTVSLRGAQKTKKKRDSSTTVVARWDSRQEPLPEQPKKPRRKKGELKVEAVAAPEHGDGELPMQFSPVENQFKLPYLEPGIQSNQEFRSEAEVQAAIIRTLTYDGFLVLETSEHRGLVHCPHCHGSFMPSGGRGCTQGVPDLLISHANWPDGVFLGLEVKGPTTPVSPEQKLLAARRRIFIVRSLEEARAPVFALHRRIKPRPQTAPADTP